MLARFRDMRTCYPYYRPMTAFHCFPLCPLPSAQCPSWRLELRYRLSTYIGFFDSFPFFFPQFFSSSSHFPLSVKVEWVNCSRTSTQQKPSKISGSYFLTTALGHFTSLRSHLKQEGWQLGCYGLSRTDRGPQ